MKTVDLLMIAFYDNSKKVIDIDEPVIQETTMNEISRFFRDLESRFGNKISLDDSEHSTYSLQELAKFIDRHVG